MGGGAGLFPAVNKEHVNGTKSNNRPHLFLDHMSNLSLEDIVELSHEEINVYDNNNPD